HLGDRGRDVTDAGQHICTLVERTCPTADQRAERLAVPLLGDERQWWRDLERREPSELLGRIDDELPEPLQDLLGVLELEEHRSAVDLVHGVQPELHGRDDPEVAATTTDRPVELRVVLLARLVESAVPPHHRPRGEVYVST